MEKKRSISMGNFLNRIEEVSNKIPQPGIFFVYLFWITAILSFILYKFDVSVINPASDTVIHVKNFFSVDGLYWFLGNLISNFTSFPPLGLVLVMTVAVGLCEDSVLMCRHTDLIKVKRKKPAL